MLTQKYGQGGTIFKNIMSMKGLTHPEGGINIQQMKFGGPTESQKEVEKDEVVFDSTTMGQYVASNSYTMPNGKTPAKILNQIKDKPVNKLRPQDNAISGPAMTAEIEKQLPLFEQRATELGLRPQEQPTAKYGGKMKYWAGGPSSYINKVNINNPYGLIEASYPSDAEESILYGTPGVGYNAALDDVRGKPIHNIYNNNAAYGYGSKANLETQLNAAGQSPSAYATSASAQGYPMNTVPIKGNFPTAQTAPVGTTNGSKKTDWGNIAGMAGNFISPIASLALAFGKTYPNKEKLAQTNLVDMSAANLAVDRNLDLFNSNYFANVKGAGQSRAQFLGNAGVHLGAASQAAGLQKSENSLKQHMINTQALNATSQYNAGARERNQEYGAKENAARREAMYKAFGDLGTAVSGTTKDSNMLKLNEKQFKQMLVMYPDLFPAGGIPTIGTDGYYHVKFPGSK